MTLFPNKDFIRGITPGQLTNSRYVNFDPGSGVAIKKGDTVGVRFNLSPATMEALGFGKNT